MAYFESEILNELKTGEEYTGRQLSIFQENNREAIFLSDIAQLIDYKNYIVTSISSDFVLKMSENYHIIPGRKSKIYKIRMV
ncbi:hypothetical protein ABC1347 [Shouchella clausii KSM-K16]|uniref:Uncharacterized protein n=1 Tax=Shouchella clausii (strain KSM-K16) TaxID=66692 RepID=Q5WIC0_SHOC1|nr:hypothetical protein [Shouchella clausii]MCZ1180379.1 hypothetical protein [Shouchella clausii]BAD63885.1 hypothetical protein ABC1347 [Shouchella clausii KSM-K16]